MRSFSSLGGAGGDVLGRLRGGRDGWGGVTLFSLRNPSRRESVEGLEPGRKKSFQVTSFPLTPQEPVLFLPFPGSGFLSLSQRRA